MQFSEQLLPGTRALPRGTVEESKYNGRYLVRVRHQNGITEREHFDNAAAAHEYALRKAEDLAAEARTAQKGR